MRRSVILLTMAWASIAWGQVSISGPDKIARDTFGEWILEGQGVDRATFDWEIIPLDDRSAPDWSRRFATKFTEVKDGVLLVGAPGRYELKVTMVGPSGDDQRPFAITKPKRVIEIEGLVDPEPGPGPGPGPNPAPIPGEGLRVLIVYESADMTKYSIETQVILAGADVREFLKKNCVQENGQAGFRIYDADVDVTDDLPVWKGAMSRPRSSLPWVIVSNGTTGFEGPLPNTPSEFLDLCKKYLPAK